MAQLYICYNFFSFFLQLLEEIFFSGGEKFQVPSSEEFLSDCSPLALGGIVSRCGQSCENGVTVQWETAWLPTHSMMRKVNMTPLWPLCRLGLGGAPAGPLDLFRYLRPDLLYFKLNQCPRGDRLQWCAATTWARHHNKDLHHQSEWTHIRARTYLHDRLGEKQVKHKSALWFSFPNEIQPTDNEGVV